MSMDKINILQVAHRLPWPPIDGGKKAALGFVENYARNQTVAGHRLLCMCPIEELGWACDWRSTAPVAFDVDAIDVRNTLSRIAYSTFFSRQPFNMCKYQRASFTRKLESVLAASVPDVVHFESLHTAHYSTIVRRLAPKALRVLRCQNAEYVILERLAESENNPLKRSIIGVHARRLKQYEARSLDDFDLILAITENDASRLRDLNPAIAPRLMVVPAGADIPAELSTLPPVQAGLIRLIHIASMDWLPNQAGLRWLHAHVLPILDRAGLSYHLDVVGKNMPKEFLAMKHPRVTVHGFVEDLRAITSQAHLALVPLWVGGGMRIKILDYWAMGIPVISTSVGAEGVAKPGDDVLMLANDPADFAAAIVSLAKDEVRRSALRLAAYRKLRNKYEWSTLVNGLVERYAALLDAQAKR